MHIYKQILLYILNENTIWPSGAIARDIVSQEKNTLCYYLYLFLKRHQGTILDEK